MLPKITFCIKAIDESAIELDKTLDSLSKLVYNNIQSIIITNNDNIDAVSKIINSNELTKSGSDVFNKNPFNIPSMCLPFTSGKIRQADILNTFIDHGADSTDIFVFISSGDTVKNTYIPSLLNSINESPGVIGLVSSDYVLNGFRVYQQSFDRTLILNKIWELPMYAIPKYVIDKIGKFNTKFGSVTEQEFFYRLNTQYISIHIPEVLAFIKNKCQFSQEDWEILRNE